jgi:FKBP-type peptidyl-prolyl cis-trans isomerase 2
MVKIKQGDFVRISFTLRVKETKRIIETTDEKEAVRLATATPSSVQKIKILSCDPELYSVKIETSEFAVICALR